MDRWRGEKLQTVEGGKRGDDEQLLSCKGT